MELHKKNSFNFSHCFWQSVYHWKIVCHEPVIIADWSVYQIIIAYYKPIIIGDL